MDEGDLYAAIKQLDVAQAEKHRHIRDEKEAAQKIARWVLGPCSFEQLSGGNLERNEHLLNVFDEHVARQDFTRAYAVATAVLRTLQRGVVLAHHNQIGDDLIRLWGERARLTRVVLVASGAL
ncbi:MAG: hypothetical protein OXU81_21845 [Gammaproteobacteria bacterium]|nr:hypothetical protein [Gammaproteobacteria bacterium]MDE2823700.1 hypothetical protein [Chloroflexota bacterium]